jgi:hypothetical protein
MGLFQQTVVNKYSTAQTAVQHIDAVDKAIDEMVYRLYELTEEDVKVVEGE